METRHGIPLSLLRRGERDLGPTVYLTVTGWQNGFPELVLRPTFASFGVRNWNGVRVMDLARKAVYVPTQSQQPMEIVELGHDFRGFALSWVGGHSREESIIHQEGQEAESRVEEEGKGERYFQQFS